jgi:hypothetical protein
MTIQGVGWTDELTDEERRAVIHFAMNELADVTEYEIQLGPPLVKGEALVLPATPTNCLHAARNRLRSAIEKALGRPPWNAAEQARGFKPHISVAYACFDADAGPYGAALNTVVPATVKIPVRHVVFVRQDRQLDPHWRYTWEELARVPLREGH